jgi:hypothetical protein
MTNNFAMTPFCQHGRVRLEANPSDERHYRVFAFESVTLLHNQGLTRGVGGN